MIIRIIIAYIAIITSAFADIEQTTAGDKSPIINSSGSGNISINYSEDKSDPRLSSYADIINPFLFDIPENEEPSWINISKIKDNKDIVWTDKKIDYSDKFGLPNVNTPYAREGKAKIKVKNKEFPAEWHVLI